MRFAVKMDLTGLLNIIRRERLYLLLLIFVLLFNLLMLTPGSGVKKKPASEKVLAGVSIGGERYVQDLDELPDSFFSDAAESEKMLKEKPIVAIIFGLASLLIFFLLCLGIVIDLLLISAVRKSGSLDISTQTLDAPSWGVIDVGKVVVLFLFFGYMLVMAETFLARAVPLIKNDNFRMILNTSVMDILAVVFIVYFAVHQYGGRIESLGINFKNFMRNVYIGLVGYLASLPVLAMAMAAILVTVKLTHYIPEQQPVVEIFLKEEGVGFLVYTSIFAAILGPIIEELFFRAFMYRAFRKSIGAFWAVMITSALFAVLHSNIVSFLPIMILGVLLAYLYEKTGTLVAPITVHMVHNLGMVMIVFLVKQLKG